MYKIDSKNVKSCIDWYYNYLSDLVKSRGIRVSSYDIGYLEDNIRNTVLKLKSLGLDVNLNSNTQVVSWLKTYYRDNIDIQSCNTAKEIISIQSKDSDDIIVVLLSRYMKLSGRLRILKALYNHLTDDGYIYPSVILTKSNRVMYKAPSILNIPKDIIWDIISTSDDKYALYSVDINTQEPKLMFNITNKDFLSKVGETDVYKYIYKECIGKECNEFERSDVKRLINLLNYDGTKASAIKSCNVLSEDIINKIIKYYNSECKFKEFSRYCSRLASNKVTTITNLLGTKLEVSGDIKARKRTIQNLYVQSLGADIIALLVKNFVNELEKRGLDKYIRLYFARVDEFIIEVDKNIIDGQNIKELFLDLFEHQVDDWVPFNVSIDRIK